MSIQAEIMAKMKEAMKSKDTLTLTALRALKSAIMLAKTESKANAELSPQQELKIVQKQVKQRKDSAKVYQEQKRYELAESELAEAKVLEEFLPKALSEDEIALFVDKVIKEVGANGIKDMGKVMGLVVEKLTGVADGKTISNIVKSKLAQ